MIRKILLKLKLLLKQLNEFNLKLDSLINMKKKLIFILVVLFTSNLWAFTPGFEWEEYETMLRFSMKNYYPTESTGFPSLEDHDLFYDSEVGPLFNKFQIYLSKDQQYAILTFRGTTREEGSWIENLFSAMLPAKGRIRLEKNKTVNYQFAEDERAAVHAGWAVGLASLLPELQEQLRSLKLKGLTHIYITGHSQGGALAHLCTSWLHYQEEFQNFQLKTYASASPKPGNFYFNVDYHNKTQHGISYNVFNSEDWVPQTFLSIQAISDLNEKNIFKAFKIQIKQQKFVKRQMGNLLYKKVAKPNEKIIKKYKKYFGPLIHKKLMEYIPELEVPHLVNSFDYHAVGHQIIMKPPKEYFDVFSDAKSSDFLYHHRGDHYLWLVNYYKR